MRYALTVFMPMAVLATGLGCSPNPVAFTKGHASITIIDTLQVPNPPEAALTLPVRFNTACYSNGLLITGEGKHFNFYNTAQTPLSYISSKTFTTEGGAPLKGRVNTAIWASHELHLLMATGKVCRYTPAGKFISKTVLDLPPDQMPEQNSSFAFHKESNTYFIGLEPMADAKDRVNLTLPFIGRFNASSGELMEHFGKLPPIDENKVVDNLLIHTFTLRNKELIVGLVGMPFIYHYSLDGRLLKSIELPDLDKDSPTTRRWWVTTANHSESGSQLYYRFAQRTRRGVSLLVVNNATTQYDELGLPWETDVMAPQVNGDTLYLFGSDPTQETEDFWLYKATVMWHDD